MRAVQTSIRATELGLALASTYMAAVTLLQTSIYTNKVKPLLLSLSRYGAPLLGGLQLNMAYVDFALLALAIFSSLMFWRRGDEIGFGRLFSLNMLLFFPSVLDFSTFNWVNLILPYDPAPRVSPLWVFGVGLLLQATYLTLRYTVRFRVLREELMGRGAEAEAVDNVSKNQMAYLALLVAGTAAILFSIYRAMPLVKGMLMSEAARLPIPHVVIGIACTILMAAATVIYLRGYGVQPEAERADETTTLEPGPASPQPK